jgi:ribosomal protein S12 methylthiotransferase
MKEQQIGVISLGCSKNRVDTELMLGKLGEAGYRFTADPAEADIILINTCGFIESAKQESIDTILEMAQYKQKGKLKALIVTGCLSGRYQGELAESLPEVDAFLGVTAQDEIVQAVEKVLQGQRVQQYHGAALEGNYADRLLTTPGYYAYVKIAEGCNNRCSYCAIPYIRGNLKSRQMPDICEEVEALASRGVKEIILVAQDTSKYGLDLYHKPMLAPLLEQLALIEGIRCIRLLYCYPDGIDDTLLDTMCKYDNIAKYIDMPIQHVDDEILKRMHRRDTHRSIYEAVEKIRQRDADFILRTTVIAGFPGETEAQFAALKQGVKELKFDRLGAFAYSREEGTPAYDMPDQLSEEVKAAREQEIMFTQQPIAAQMGRRRVGRIYDVLMEAYDPEESLYFGRSYGEAPGVDGMIAVESDIPLQIGMYYKVRILRADDYELLGRAIQDE